MKDSWKILICVLALSSLLVGCTSESQEPSWEMTSTVVPTLENTPTTASTSTQGIIPPSFTPQPTEVVFVDKTVEKIPVIYSHGGGPCDIGGMAFLSKHPNVDLIGYVLTEGEYYPKLALDLWPIYLFDVLDSKHTSLGLGSDKPMDPTPHDFPEAWRPASTNFWNLTLPEKVTDYEADGGHELIVDLVNNSEEKVTILAMASLIDVALAIQADPGIIDNISHVVLMGGAFTIPGNLSDAPYPINNEVAEWNIWVDSEAAKYVFNSGVPMSIVPLDAIQYLVQSEDVYTINKINDPAVNYVAQIWNNQIRANRGGFLIWDTITATAVTNPENFYWTVDGVDVITEPDTLQGQTIALQNGAVHTRYATGADYEAIMAQLFETFRGETMPWGVSDHLLSDSSSDAAPTPEPNLVSGMRVLLGTQP